MWRPRAQLGLFRFIYLKHSNFVLWTGHDVPLRTRAIPERFCGSVSLRRGAIKCMHLLPSFEDAHFCSESLCLKVCLMGNCNYGFVAFWCSHLWSVSAAESCPGSTACLEVIFRPQLALDERSDPTTPGHFRPWTGTPGDLDYVGG